MKKSTIVLLVVLVIAVAVGVWFAFGRADESNSTTTEQNTTEQTPNESAPPEDTAAPAGNTDQANATDEVEIEDFAFSPKSITIKKGTTVTWTNKDDVQHNVIPDDGDSEAFKGSSLLAKDQSYSFTFNTPGTYTYHCGPHPQMTATVTVTE